MDLVCDVCNKKYKTYASYEKHRKHHHRYQDNTTLIFTLLNRIETLEEQVRENTTYIRLQRKKINAIEYLNLQSLEFQQSIPNLSEFIKSLNLTREILKKFLSESKEKSPISCLGDIIIKLLCDATPHIPIRCFIKKKYKLYVKDQDVWSEMEDTQDLDTLISRIQCKLLVLYEKRAKKLEENGCDIHKTYFEDKQRILLNGNTQEIVSNRIKRMIWEKFKQEIEVGNNNF